MLMPPSIAECVQLAKDPEIQLSERDAKIFWAHYESNGWRVGKVPMVSLRGAMMGWKLRNSPTEADIGQNPTRFYNGIPNGHLSGMDKKVFSGELDRVLENIRQLKGSYSENMEMTLKDREKLQKLITRRKELKNLLGIQY